MNYYNTVIIGSGCAAYNAADRLHSLGVTDIALVTEGRLMGTSRNTGSDKQTYYKLSLAGSDGDSVRELARSLFDGGGVNGDIALTEAAYSVRCFMRLVELGVPFPSNEYGEYVGYKTDHDPRSRATSCGPLTSKLMTEALENSVIKRKIKIFDGLRVIKIIKENGHTAGIAALDRTGELTMLGCENVILATGGPAGIYFNSVYPESQSGGTGLALDAGATAANLEEWQYGLASVKFRWNVSGTYQQVLPRFISVSPDGTEREFLAGALGGRQALDMTFLKGYQWPFDTRKSDGSSRVDLLVNGEISRGNRVFMDFRSNPSALADGFGILSGEAYGYLESSGALCGTPIKRLEIMNRKAIELYASHGIDLYREPLEVAVCAQHCNGGIAVDADWQTDVPGLYAVGEAAGTFGVYRPGGSALNSAQVGSLRAAEHISRKPGTERRPVPRFTLPQLVFADRGGSNLDALRRRMRSEMSRVAAFDRDSAAMLALFNEARELKNDFFERVRVCDKSELAELFRFYDSLTTQCAVLSAMLCSAEHIGTHGAAMVDGNPLSAAGIRGTQTLTRRLVSHTEPVRPIPDAELWFERVWNRPKDI